MSLLFLAIIHLNLNLNLSIHNNRIKYSYLFFEIDSNENKNILDQYFAQQRNFEQCTPSLQLCSPSQPGFMVQSINSGFFFFVI